ncbi:hypothetical protein [Hyphomicrobiales bacterium]|uniref:hypothetical protein n=1 Tax=Agrobacterium cavarae TaxID=2528239 RepID=UPI000DD3D46B
MKKPLGDLETLTDMADFCAMFHANWLPTLKSEAGNAIEDVTRRKVFSIYTYALLESCADFSRWDEEHHEYYSLINHPPTNFLIEVLRFHGRAVTTLYQSFHPDQIMALTYFRHSLVHINISAHRSGTLQVFKPEMYVIEQSKTKSAQESMEKIGKAVGHFEGLLQFNNHMFETFCSVRSALWPLVGEILHPQLLQSVIKDALAQNPDFQATDEQTALSDKFGSIRRTLYFHPTMSLSEAPYWKKIADGDRQL